MHDPAHSPARPPATRRWGALAALVTMLAMVATAGAHTLPRERTLIVQVSADRVEVLVEYLEPPGASIDLLFRRFDLDHDGRLRGPEAKLAGSEWLGRVLRGLQFEVVGEKPRAHPPELKFHREQRGSLTSALYARWDVDPLEPGQKRTVRVRMLRVPENVATETTFRPGDHTTIVGLDLPPQMRQAPARPMLRAGQQASVTVRRPQKTDGSR